MRLLFRLKSHCYRASCRTAVEWLWDYDVRRAGNLLCSRADQLRQSINEIQAMFDKDAATRLL